MASKSGHHVPGTPYEWRHGWIRRDGAKAAAKALVKPRFPEIRKGDLTTPDARRSPAVTSDVFQQHAKRGAAKVARLKGQATPPSALEGPQFKRITDEAYDSTRSPWGGITVDAHTGKHVAPDANLYALTMRNPGSDSVHVDPKASREVFDNAMDEARKRFHEELSRPGAHLGVFYDEDTNSIDIDPVLVTPSLKDVHDIGAFTHAVGGAYHFKSGNGYWPPHVKETTKMDLSIDTPFLHDADFDLSSKGGKLAYWKQILPMKTVHYTAKDGSRQKIDFTRQYLEGLALSKAVDKVGFLLADKDNAHTMDPERWRGEVAQMEVRDDGLYGKIVFPSPEAAKAVLDNPDLGVSARIRPNVQRSDGSTLDAGIIHVLGTLDPQVSGMSPWQATDLSNEGEYLDLTQEEYADMADKTKALADYTEADIEAMTEEELDTFLATYVPEFDAYTGDEHGEHEEHTDETKPAEEKTLVGAGADMSKQTGTEDIELANQATAAANARAEEALRRVAEAEWREERSELLSAGVPPHALDLAAPVLNRADDMVIDLSNSAEDDVNVSQVVRDLLDSMKGMVDLSTEEGHSGHFDLSNGEDPDKDALDRWDSES